MLKAVFLDQASLGEDLDFSCLYNLNVEWVMYPTTSPEQTLKRCKKADVVITNKVVLDERLISQLPDLKLICVAATGVNNIDIDAAEQANITVKNVVDYAGGAVAQQVFAFLLQLFNQSNSYQQAVNNGQWSKSPFFCMLDYPIFELAGKTLGLIGYGNLGKSVEKIAKAFDMKVLIAEHKNIEEIRVGRTSFEDTLKHSDVISIHCPLNAETENLIANPEFELMKDSAILINTARGGIVNEQNLLAALRSGKIAAAATDVLAQEPPLPTHQMITEKPENLLITPHIAWASFEARSRLLQQLADNIQNFINERN